MYVYNRIFDSYIIVFIPHELDLYKFIKHKLSFCTNDNIFYRPIPKIYFDSCDFKIINWSHCVILIMITVIYYIVKHSNIVNCCFFSGKV